MSLLVIGFNGKTAPLALREQLLFWPHQLPAVAASLAQRFGAQGTVVLSTCNRTELYLQMAPSPLALEEQLQALIGWWCHFHRRVVPSSRDHFYGYRDQVAVNHLMRVASGLDSPILGEPQILGQVKQAYHQAQQAHLLTPLLIRLFQRVFYTARRIRSETALGSQAVSVAVTACRLARQRCGSWPSTSVLLIGAGNTIGAVARYLQHQGVASITIANRSRERAAPLAEKVNATLIALSDIPKTLSAVEVVISATTSPAPIIDRAMMTRVRMEPCWQQRAKPLVLIDLAVPHDIAADLAPFYNPLVNQVSQKIERYTIDDLQMTFQHNRIQRQAAAQEAERMVAQACADFSNGSMLKERTETIRRFRQQADQLRQRLEGQAVIALQRGEGAEQVVRTLAYKLTNQLLHRPTKLLQAACQQQDEIVWQQLQACLDISQSLEQPVLERSSGA